MERCAGDPMSHGYGMAGELAPHRVVEQYQTLLLLYPDAQALWFLLSRALAHDATRFSTAVTSAAALNVAQRLFASSVIAVPRPAGGTVQVEEDDSDGASGTWSDSWRRVDYLRGSRDMTDAVQKYGRWQLTELERARDQGDGGKGLRFLVFTPGPEGFGNR